MKTIIYLLSAVLLTSCIRPLTSRFVNKCFDNYADFKAYMDKQDSYRIGDYNYSFNYQPNNAAKSEYHIEGIDVTHSYKKTMSRADYKNTDFCIMKQRYSYIVNYISEFRIILGFAPLSENQFHNKVQFEWVEIFGNVEEKYGSYEQNLYDYYYSDVTKQEDLLFRITSYEDGLKKGMSLRNHDNIPVAFLFTDAESSDYLSDYLNEILNIIKGL